MHLMFHFWSHVENGYLHNKFTFTQVYFHQNRSVPSQVCRIVNISRSALLNDIIGMCAHSFMLYVWEKK